MESLSFYLFNNNAQNKFYIIIIYNNNINNINNI